MIVLLIGVIFGIAIAYFATQNTTPVTVQIGEYAFANIPLYLAMVWALFVGVFISCILYLARAVSSRVTIYGKDHAMRRARRVAADLEQRVRRLEAENSDLRTNHQSSPLEAPEHTTTEPRPIAAR
ncbi:MAG: lipopolysaccharide assembly protein LapA domain-containing protein [Alphaproteobacteria bacterium]